jgi:hypothetical protein
LANPTGIFPDGNGSLQHNYRASIAATTCASWSSIAYSYDVDFIWSLNPFYYNL